MAVEPAGGPPGPGLGRAELLAALSLAIDLGLGQPMEHMLRSSLMATRLAGRLGLDEHQRGVVYYANLVEWIGCHADSHELADWFGDDIAFRADSYRVDWTGLPFLGLLLRHVGRDRPLLARGGRAVSFLVDPRRRLSELIHSHCASAGVLAERVGLGEGVREALAYSFERWDGSGLPVGAQGDGIPVEMRVVQLAEVAEVHHRLGGVDAAVRMARGRSGTQFDPAVVATFVRCAGEILDGVPGDVWGAALAQAPERDRLLPDRGWDSDRVLGAMGRVAGPLLRAGRVRLQGTVPNGQHFPAAPRLVWAVADSTALVGGHDAGLPGPLPQQDRLGDFWLPQRGIFAVGTARFDPYDPTRHHPATQTASA